MTKHAIRLSLFVLLTAVGGLLTGCKSESSPTAPSTTTTPPTQTTPTTPPNGASVTLSFSNSSPVAPADVVVTATVALNGAPVPNGTAVQFATNIGTFKETAATTALRTTTNGVATVTLTSSSAGSGTVTATVNNVQKSATITFGTQPTTTTPPPTNPTITGITPNTGIPQGGTVITITGTNFRTPVRVIVDPGGGQQTKDAFVNQVSPTQIIAVMPAFDVSTGSTLPVSITVVDEAGTANQQSVTQATAFTYAAAVLTPSIRTLDPTSGPIDGGTRIAILGDAFQAPVQVFFGSAEAQVLRVTFNEIDVVSPTARDTAPTAGVPVTGPVDVRVLNVNSGKSATSPQPFRYIAAMQITTVSPSVGSSLGGTDLLIDGTGFVAPVTVDIGLPLPIITRAQVLSVSPTEIRARTVALAVPCGEAAGNLRITVTNTNNGDSTVSPPSQTFTFVPVPALITSVAAPANLAPGNSITANVQNPSVGLLGTANVAFTIGGVPAVVTPQTITTGTGTQSFNIVVPGNLPYQQVGCSTGGLNGFQNGPTAFIVAFNNTTTGCSATSAQTVTVIPPNPNPCNVIPPVATVTAPANAACADAGSATAGSISATKPTITITNTASGSAANALQISNTTISGANAADFTISPNASTPISVPPGASANFTITFKPGATGARNATVTFTTNDPAHPTVAVCLTGTGT